MNSICIGDNVLIRAGKYNIFKKDDIFNTDIKLAGEVADNMLDRNHADICLIRLFINKFIIEVPVTNIVH